MIFIIIIICLSILTAMPSYKKETEMTDFKKITESVPTEYRKQKKVNGVNLDTFFFKNWEGYSHPVSMYNPLRYEETQTRGDYSYYEASLDTSGQNPLLILVEKYFVRRGPVKLEIEPTDRTGQKDVYYLFHKENNQIILKKQVSLDDTFNVTEYIHVALNDKGEPVKSELCRKEFWSSYEYIYDERGLLRIITKTADRGTFVQERGKDF